MTHNTIDVSPAPAKMRKPQNSSTWLPAESVSAMMAASDLMGVENVLKNSLSSQVPEPKLLGDRLILAGGKRLRPFLLNLMARSLSLKNSLPWRGNEEDLFHLGAVSELVHTATLFHDDVIDQSATRREMPSAHILHGNKCAILVGDFVYAEAFSVLMGRGLLHPSRDLALTVKTIVEGELLQLKLTQSRSLDLNEYMQVARAKTASLFAWCTGTGAWLSGIENFAAAAKFGQHLGLAFQMADDVIDCFEMNPFLAPEAELTAWFESAPPFPLVQAAVNVSAKNKIANLWNQNFAALSLQEKRSLVNELQLLAADELNLAQTLSSISALLLDSENILRELGIFDDMSWTTQSIQSRAEQGSALAKLTGSSETRHVIL